MSRSLRLALTVQGVYYLVTGVWPFVSLETFEWVTGPKTDDWLVHTVGLLLVAVAASLLTAAKTLHASLAVSVLAIGSALALATIEVAYVGSGRIRSIYLVDTAIEIVLAMWQLVAVSRSRLGAA